MNTPLLDIDDDDHIRLRVTEARELGEAALAALGLTGNEAQTVTEHLIDASLCGYAFAGLPRILVMADRPEMKAARKPISIVRETPVSAMIDGGNHVGYIAITKAVDIGLQKAATNGIALIGMRNSWFGGRGTHYLERISRAGYGAIYAVSSTPTVVPPGSRRKALGTNPLAFALPGQPDPFIFDMGTASVMSGEVMMHALLGQDFPGIVGIDADGAPTSNARALLEGGVFPFGGHKGYGLSLTVQALGLLAGARSRNGEVSDFGYFIVIFDPALLMPRDEFALEMDALRDMIRNLPRQPGVEEIRLPTERGFSERVIRKRQGIVVHRTVLTRLQSIANSDPESQAGLTHLATGAP